MRATLAAGSLLHSNMRLLILSGLIIPALLAAEVRVPATYYRVSEVVIIRKTESAVLVTDRVLFRRSPFGINDPPDGIGWSAWVRMSPIVDIETKTTPPLAKEAIKVTASNAHLDSLRYIKRQAHGQMAPGGYYLAELLLEANPPEVLRVELTYRVDLSDSPRSTLSFTPTFENSEHIPPVVWEELAAWRIFIEGVADDRVEVSQGGVKMAPVRDEFANANEPTPYWFRKDGEVAIRFK